MARKHYFTYLKIRYLEIMYDIASAFSVLKIYEYETLSTVLYNLASLMYLKPTNLSEVKQVVRMGEIAIYISYTIYNHKQP